MSNQAFTLSDQSKNGTLAVVVNKINDDRFEILIDGYEPQDCAKISLLRERSDEWALRVVFATPSSSRAFQTTISLSGAKHSRCPEYEASEDDSFTYNALFMESNVGDVLVAIDGYGTAVDEKEFAHPICIELNDGQVRLHAWGDINQVDPTATLVLIARDPSKLKI